MREREKKVSNGSNYLIDVTNGDGRKGQEGIGEIGRFDGNENGCGLPFDPHAEDEENGRAECGGKEGNPEEPKHQ